MKNIYVGNLNFQTVPEELRKIFEPYGGVRSVSIPRHPATLRSRGFDFVEMPDDAAAEQAIQGLNGSTLGGRRLTVHEARPRPERAEGRRLGGEHRFGRD